MYQALVLLEPDTATSILRTSAVWQRNCFTPTRLSGQGFMPELENKLGTKPTKHLQESGSMT
jgi:hypothetical protein